MFNWLKSLFTGKTTPEQEEAPQAAPGASMQAFHVEKHVHEKKPALPDFESMTKLELDVWARDQLKLKLDRRKTKSKMIERINNHLNKEN